MLEVLDRCAYSLFSVKQSCCCIVGSSSSTCVGLIDFGSEVVTSSSSTILSAWCIISLHLWIFRVTRTNCPGDPNFDGIILCNYHNSLVHLGQILMARSTQLPLYIVGRMTNNRPPQTSFHMTSLFNTIDIVSIATFHVDMCHLRFDCPNPI
jgi:hypothetical protein